MTGTDPELLRALNRVPEHLRMGVAAVLADADAVSRHAPAHTLPVAVAGLFIFSAALDPGTDRDVRDELLTIALGQGDRLRLEWVAIVPHVPSSPGEL